MEGAFLVSDPRERANLLADIVSANSALDTTNQNNPVLNFASLEIPTLKFTPDMLKPSCKIFQ